MYICPMHPDVVSNKPGVCKKCGMKLLLKAEVDSNKNNYTPLIVIILLITTITLVLSLRDLVFGLFMFGNSISYFMVGFFLVFSGFKLMDLKGFAQGYSMYDLLAKHLYFYGYIYPFIELCFGLLMLLNISFRGLFIFEFAVMFFSGVGVLVKLLKREKFQCACLGTFLKVPLTQITLVEDFGMAGLALLMIVMR